MPACCAHCWTPDLVSRSHCHYFITDRCWHCHIVLIIRVNDDNHFLQEKIKVSLLFLSISFLLFSIYKLILKGTSPGCGVHWCILCGRSHDMFRFFFCLFYLLALCHLFSIYKLNLMGTSPESGMHRCDVEGHVRCLCNHFVCFHSTPIRLPMSHP